MEENIKTPMIYHSYINRKNKTFTGSRAPENNTVLRMTADQASSTEDTASEKIAENFAIIDPLTGVTE